MKYIQYFLVAALLVGSAVIPARAQESGRVLPTPSTVSGEIQVLIAAPPFSYWNDHPKSTQEWKTWADALGQEGARGLAALREQLGVTVTQEHMGGVPIFILSPKDLPKTHEDRVLLHFHGGGYILGAGESGTQEAILMAGIGKFRVVSADYRVAPDFPYPAAIDDAMTVYRELLKERPAEKIGVFGTSTGGGVMKNPLPYKEENVHYGWLNGDIDFARDSDYFTILFEDEKNSEQYGHQINIGKIDCELSVISTLQGSFDVRIELAN